MQKHNVTAKTKRMAKRRVGRGGTRGKTSGRGHKGQKARAGHRIRPEIRDMIKRLPKLRGRGKNSNKSIAPRVRGINVSVLEEVFADGASITPTTLRDAGLSGRNTPVKILSGGTLNKKLHVSNVPLSRAAKEKIEAAGGSVV